MEGTCWLHGECHFGKSKACERQASILKVLQVSSVSKASRLKDPSLCAHPLRAPERGTWACRGQGPLVVSSGGRWTEQQCAFLRACVSCALRSGERAGWAVPARSDPSGKQVTGVFCNKARPPPSQAAKHTRTCFVCAGGCERKLSGNARRPLSSPVVSQHALSGQQACLERSLCAEWVWA